MKNLKRASLEKKHQMMAGSKERGILFSVVAHLSQHITQSFQTNVQHNVYNICTLHIY